MAWMPGASRVQTFGGNTHRAKIDKIVIHTTEGGSWPGYAGGGNAPHFTVHRNGTIRQHISTSQSSKALENDRGGVQTNNDGCVQIEYIGSCDRSWANKHGLFFVENATDDDLAPLAKVVAWIAEQYDVPLTDRGLRWTDTNAAYEGAPQRMSFAQWRAFSGVCGHQHVPENAHWDPGKLDVARVIQLAKGSVAVRPKPQPKPVPAVKKNGQITVDSRFGHGTVTVFQEYLLEHHADTTDLGKDGVDGKAGINFWKSLQGALGTKVDGEVSNQSHKAESLGNGITQGWDYDGPNAKGSSMVRAMQKWAGAKVDGVWGEKTSGAVQRRLNKVNASK